MISRIKTSLLVALAGLFMSTPAYAYLTQADCEEYEGVGKCEFCDGGWHRASGCALLAAVDLDEGDVLSATEYTELVSIENDHYMTRVAKAHGALKAAVSSGVGVAEALSAENTALQAVKTSKAELTAAAATASHAAEVAHSRCEGDGALGEGQSALESHAAGCALGGAGGGEGAAAVGLGALALALVQRRRRREPRQG